jgi:protein-S-isoprenylcysteine O-methyltransferase
VGVIFNATVLVWLAIEAGLQLRERRLPRSSVDLDRGTTRWVGLSLGAGIALGFVLSHHASSGPALDRRLFGAAVLVASGAALRVWCVRTLGNQFRVVVAVERGSRLVTDGPDRIVRHPSYAALLVALAGIGVADGSALSVLACTVVPAVGIVRRIKVEEEALAAAFGSDYADYARRTRRMVPGIW